MELERAAGETYNSRFDLAICHVRMQASLIWHENEKHVNVANIYYM